jgi:hypothetical protein
VIAKLDKLTLVGIALGIGVMVQPWWHAGFRVGFFLTLAFTIAQIVTSHMLPATNRGADE